MKNRLLGAFAALTMLVGVGVITTTPAVASFVEVAPAKDLKGGVDAPKGNPTPGDLKSSKAVCGSPSRCFSYAGVYEFLGSAPAGADVVTISTSQHKPYLNTANDFHSLWEVSAQNDSTTPGLKNTVEVGWNVDMNVNGDLNTHLFVYHWVNGSTSCYNGCGWVDNPTEAVNAGTTLATTASGASPTVFYEYKIGRANSVKCDGVAPVQTTATLGWFVYQQNVGSTRIIGCFPDKLWVDAGETFTKVNLVQAFQEVASTDDHPCTDKGSGVFSPGSWGTLSASQWQKDFAISGAPAGVTADWTASGTPAGTTTAAITPSFQSPTAYRILPDTATPSNEVREGGPGYDVNGGTATGSVGNC